MSALHRAGDNVLADLIDSTSEAETDSQSSSAHTITTDDSEEVLITSDSKPTDGQCYCGQTRNLNEVELICSSCNLWFHESCMGNKFGNLVSFMSNYVFICKKCSPRGEEVFKKNPATILQLCVTAIGNLMQASKKNGEQKKYFDKDEDIIPFISSCWDRISVTGRKMANSWQNMVQRTLQKKGSMFKSVNEGGKNLYGLVFDDVQKIKPNYQVMINTGVLLKTENGMTIASNFVAGRKKRKVSSDVPVFGISRKKRGTGESTMTKLSIHGYPIEFPFNKENFRYILAEPDPHAPFRDEFEDFEDSRKPIPGWLCRQVCPKEVLLAINDRAPQLQISEDCLSVTGEKGYCTVRATHSVTKGVWYYEATITEMEAESACRIGWCLRHSNLQAPVGYNKMGYCWRSKKGTKFHNALGKHYSDGYGVGDVLGFLIYLPERNRKLRCLKDMPLVKFKSHLYYEEKLEAIEDRLRPLKGSKITYFKNGVSQGTAYEDIFEGEFYPAVSIFRNATVAVNFGPDFQCAPSGVNYKPVSDRVEELIVEDSTANLMYLIENERYMQLF